MEIIQKSLQDTLAQIMGFMSRLMGGIILLVVGWILAKMVSKVVGTFLSRPAIKGVIDKFLDSAFDNGSDKVNAPKVLEQIVYWFIFLIFLLSATEAVGLNMLSQEIARFVQFIPKLFSSLMIFLLGLYMAKIIQNVSGTALKSMGIKAWKLFSSLVFGVVALMISVTSLNQVGLDTSILTSNFTIIVAGIALAFALAYGYAGRDLLKNILTAFYSKNHFKVGQVVEVEGVKGLIVQIDNMTVTLENEQGKVIIPMNRMFADKVIIFDPMNRG